MEDIEYHVARLLSVTRDVVGYAVVPTLNQSKNSKERAARKVFLNYMGFKDVKEYSKTYPGNLKKASKQCQEHEHLKNGAVYKSKNLYVYFLETLVYDIDHINSFVWIEYTINDYYNNRNGGVDFQIYPKIDDIKKIYGCKNIDESKLWFCEDWNEEVGT